MLFTGDMTKEVEEELISSVKDVDVLKVAHHGSKTSTSMSFLNVVRAESSLISVGKNNPFGHPHESVLDNLKTSGVTIYRTDHHGALTLKYADGQSTIVSQHP